ncbi:MAG: non-canonical purine NTP pyrophosphatase, partial [Gammaproteobacteria bacterium]|nr:non-canonical purine NTP pyrophosphatase [Gammaproteobacteria bacterium]
MKLVAATGNQGKLRELRSILTGHELLSQSELGIGGAEETGSTFVENAILKARHAADASSLPALADDSGLEVPALAGAPGIYSARFAGPGATDADNCNCLLDKLGDNADRRARFRCVLVVMRHALDPAPLICQGSWQGEIAAAIAGSNGFGYD